MPVQKHFVCQYIIFSFCTGKGKFWYASTNNSILYWHKDRVFYDGVCDSAQSLLVLWEVTVLLKVEDLWKKLMVLLLVVMRRC